MTHLTPDNLAELDKFFVVAKEYFNETGQRANMPSCVVDSCWHELMEDEAQYVTFSQRSVGGAVKHLENKGYGLIEWVPVYERLFGKLANPWFIAPEGKPETGADTEYRQTGELRMAWDCTPGISDEKAKYEKTGELKAAWDCTPAIECPKDKAPARAEYERTGKLVASWDCSPDQGDDGDDIKRDVARPCTTRKYAAPHATVH